MTDQSQGNQVLPNINNAQSTEPVKEQPTSTETAKTGGKTYTEAELEQIVKDRLNREKSASEKKQAEAAQKAAAEAAAKNGEWEKLAKQREEELAKLMADMKSHELTDLRRSIGTKIGLPAEVAELLPGDTPEAIEAKAKDILEKLPKPTQRPGPVINPGTNASQQETWEQKKARLTGNNPAGPFTGGGVIWGNDTKPE